MGVGNEELKQFLKKPIIIGSGVISDTASVGQILFKYNLKTSTLFPSGGIWHQKIQGFYGLSGDVRIRLQVNANPFQCGMLRLCYVPCEPDMGALQWNRIEHPTSFSQLPGLVYDIACNTEMDLVIPYKHVYSQYQMSTGLGSWGSVYCFYYTPFYNAVGASLPDFTVWASLENVSLSGPTLPIVAQAGSRKVRMANKEQENAAGPVQSFIDSAIPYVDALAEVPFLSSFAKPVSWIANGVSAVCSWFGWSKPLNTPIPNRIQRTYFPDLNHMNSASNALPLAASRNNEVEIMPELTWNNEDEMTIGYVCQKSAYYTKFDWNTGAGASTELLQIPVGPSYYKNVGNGKTFATPTCYISSFFGMWRGSICFTFRFAKTQYHSGRLVVSFAPLGPTETTKNITLTDSNYLLREIVDIKEGAVFSLQIPYVNIVPYLMTNQTCGVISVRVVNPLTAPANVTSTIQCVVEQYGGPDLEFGFLRDNGIVFDTTLSTNNNIVPQSGIFRKRVADGATPECVISNKIIGNATIHPDMGSLQARFCLGERVTSLKQLCMRASYFPTLDSAGVDNGLQPSLKPHVFNSAIGLEGTNDTISKIAPLYTFARGSVTLTCMNVNPGTTTQLMGLVNGCNRSTSSNIGGGTTAGTFQNLNTESFALEDLKIAPLIVNVPMYTQGPALLVTPYTGANAVDVSTVISSRSYLFKISSNGDMPAVTILRSGADDFYCSLFTGVPAIKGGLGSLADPDTL